MIAPVRMAPVGGRFAPFWRGCAQGVLLITRCAGCGTWYWYPPLGCRRCGGDKLEWTDAGRTGSVFSFTVAHRSFLPPGAADVPYAVVLVELDGAPGVRLLGNLVEGQPAVGQRVRVEFRPAGEHMVPVFVADKTDIPIAQ
jgi:uncharacterized OB-fold protein